MIADFCKDIMNRAYHTGRIAKRKRLMISLRPVYLAMGSEIFHWIALMISITLAEKHLDKITIIKADCTNLDTRRVAVICFSRICNDSYRAGTYLSTWILLLYISNKSAYFNTYTLNYI